VLHAEMESDHHGKDNHENLETCKFDALSNFAREAHETGMVPEGHAGGRCHERFPNVPS